MTADEPYVGLKHKQYLAVAPFPSRNHSPTIGVRVHRPAHACIQLWSLSKSANGMDVDDNADIVQGEDPGEMRCEMVVCIESGPAFELKWCPLPANDSMVVRSITIWRTAHRDSRGSRL